MNHIYQINLIIIIYFIILFIFFLLIYLHNTKSWILIAYSFLLFHGYIYPKFILKYMSFLFSFSIVPLIPLYLLLFWKYYFICKQIKWIKYFCILKQIKVLNKFHGYFLDLNLQCPPPLPLNFKSKNFIESL